MSFRLGLLDFRNLLLIALLGGFLISCTDSKTSTIIPEKPNILFITTDYTRGVDLPIDGYSPFLKAPTLAKLCEEGAVFTRHSCTAPICMPARATIVSGHYPHSHSLWDNRSIPTRQKGLPFMIDDLKKAGYKTAGIGKMHFNPRFDDYNYDLRVTLEGKDVNYQEDDYEKYLESKGRSRKDLKDMSGKRGFPRGQSFFDWYLNEDLHPDFFVGNESVKAINEGFLDGDQPWFMWVSFTGPHNPWNAPERFASYYRDLPELPTGDFIEGELDSKPIEYSRHRYGYGGNLFTIYDAMDGQDKSQVRKELRAGHYGLLSLIDEQIGMILAVLDDRKQLENTIVIFSSDHGSALFDNNMLHKGSSFPTQSIVPFVVWAPDFVVPGKRNNFTSHVDLYATLLDIAGYKDISGSEGNSFKEMLVTPDTEIKDFVVIESTLVTSIMTKKWIYGIHHLSGEQELYNLKIDPMCHNNIVTQTGNEAIIEEMATRITEWRKDLSFEREVGDNPFLWFEELGDTSQIRNYRTGYLNEYMRLTQKHDSLPGITGSKAKAIVEDILSKQKLVYK